uniref:Phostensin n=1 Tax=Sander lucioperca TaxID=283035 RepID=A0A8C9XPH9_SANLU
MSVSSLPEWKQLLLEKKRREEEERERRGKEEEEKFASMPAWKRGIIQRRKAKQDSLGDREKDRDVCLLQVDVRSDNLKPESQVSIETIVPVHENPFIRTQSAWRKGRDLSEEEEEEYTSPVQSLSPLPPHPSSLATMSRIYNLETVGSRSGLCLRERTVDIPSVHLVKLKPLMSSAQQGDSKAFSGEDICGVQTIQRQIEQFQLKEQDTLKSPNTPFKDRETQGQQSPRGVLKHQVKDDAKTPEKDQETSELSPKVSPWRLGSPTSQLKQSNQTITITPSLLRSLSPDNTLKSSDHAPTPASSPSSLSPAQSPSVSPSPTPSPTLFSIRSASGGQVKRGATITITPKKPARGGVTGPTTGSTAGGSKSAKTSSQQAQTTSAVTEPVKKKYPTVEEIKVIGGYQNLEKSCLIKNRGSPKRVSGNFFNSSEVVQRTSPHRPAESPFSLWENILFD